MKSFDVNLKIVLTLLTYNFEKVTIDDSKRAKENSWCILFLIYQNCNNLFIFQWEKIPVAAIEMLRKSFILELERKC